MLKISIFSMDLHGNPCTYIRLFSVMEWAKEEVSYKWAAVPDEQGNLTIDPVAVEWADIYLIQRFFPTPYTISFIEDLIASGKPVIYETDDLLVSGSAGNYQLHESVAYVAPYVEQVIKKATAITVSTAVLRDYYSHLREDITVLPNLIDANLWQGESVPKQSEGVVIAFSGTNTHAKDLELVEDALITLHSTYPTELSYLFMGCATESLLSLPNANFVPFVEQYSNYAALMKQLPIDIGIAPLAESRFNASKSNIKWLEFSMCNIAGIYSDSPAYNSSVENDKTGVLVANGDWFDALNDLVRAESKRKEIATAAKQKVLAEYSIENNAEVYLNFWRSLV